MVDPRVKDGDIIHQLSHVNVEKRAGRTLCGRYVEFTPEMVVEGEGKATCLECAATPLPVTVVPDAAVDERGDDVARRCGSDHMVFQDANGRCTECGYGIRRPR